MVTDYSKYLIIAKFTLSSWRQLKKIILPQTTVLKAHNLHWCSLVSWHYVVNDKVNIFLSVCNALSYFSFYLSKSGSWLLAVALKFSANGLLEYMIHTARLCLWQFQHHCYRYLGKISNTGFSSSIQFHWEWIFVVSVGVAVVV